MYLEYRQTNIDIKKSNKIIYKLMLWGDVLILLFHEMNLDLNKLKGFANTQTHRTRSCRWLIILRFKYSNKVFINSHRLLLFDIMKQIK